MRARYARISSCTRNSDGTRLIFWNAGTVVYLDEPLLPSNLPVNILLVRCILLRIYKFENSADSLCLNSQIIISTRILSTLAISTYKSIIKSLMASDRETESGWKKHNEYNNIAKIFRDAAEVYTYFVVCWWTYVYLCVYTLILTSSFNCSIQFRIRECAWVHIELFMVCSLFRATLLANIAPRTAVYHTYSHILRSYECAEHDWGGEMAGYHYSEKSNLSSYVLFLFFCLLSIRLISNWRRYWKQINNNIWN